MAEKDNTTKPVILVVDDEELLRWNAADLLKENGFSVVEACDAEAAMKLMAERPDVRLLFTDIQMPGAFDGMELARQVHARWPNVLLLITSGRVAPAPEDIPDDGRFIAKPYQAKELVEEVRSITGNQ